MRITIRPGTNEDIPWIQRLMAEGTRDGHFGQTVPHQALQMLNQILAKRPFTMLTLEDDRPKYISVMGELAVAEIDGVAVSFLVCMRYEDRIELHLASTNNAYRRQGAFKALVEHSVEDNPSGLRIIARCYRKSTWAKLALTRLGFEVTKDGNPAEFAYRHKIQGEQT